MVQQVIILLLFSAAAVYLLTMVYRSFRRTGCDSGCGKCGVDFSKLEKTLRGKELS